MGAIVANALSCKCFCDSRCKASSWWLCRWPGAIAAQICSSSSPGGCSACTQSIADFTALLAELRAAVGTSLLLTVALRASPTPQLHYQLPQLVQSVDWINLMSYDYVRVLPEPAAPSGPDVQDRKKNSHKKLPACACVVHNSAACNKLHVHVVSVWQGMCTMIRLHGCSGFEQRSLYITGMDQSARCVCI